LGQLKAEQVDQVVGDAVQQQAEGIGEEVVTALAVGAEAVLELLDAVLALTTVVVESENLRRAACAVGDEETQVGSRRRVLGLVADAALARPVAGAIAEAVLTAACLTFRKLCRPEGLRTLQINRSKPDTFGTYFRFQNKTASARSQNTFASTMLLLPRSWANAPVPFQRQSQGRSYDGQESKSRFRCAHHARRRAPAEARRGCPHE